MVSMRVALVALLLLPLAAGQMDLSVEDNRLYGYSDGSLYLGMEPGSESLEAADGDNPTAEGPRGWTFPLPNGIGQGITLAGDVAFAAEIGGSTGAGQVDLTFELFSGETLLATASVGGHQYAGAYEPVALTAPILVSELEAGAPLSWVITATGPNAQMFIHTDGTAHVTLPITGVVAAEAPVPAAGAIAYHELVDGVATIPVNGTQAVANWTAGLGLHNVTFNITILSGFLNLTLESDGVSATQTVPVNITHAFDVQGPGNVTLTIDGTNGIGQVAVQILSPADEVVAVNATQEVEPMDEQTDAPGEDSPGLPLVAVLAAIVLALRRK